MDKEQRWLSRLAPLLPLAVPVPLGRGRPDQGYPWTWSVYRWLDGESLLAEPVTDPPHLAVELGRFITALRAVNPVGGPPPGTHNFFRGAPPG
ncbi:phosphotransferase, partial [Frankia tisae]|uniref:phosphotransferase n=1 Tax=Frankia tisae TaxID=2950104 RepID=UPI0021C15AEC